MSTSSFAPWGKLQPLNHEPATLAVWICHRYAPGFTAIVSQIAREAEEERADGGVSNASRRTLYGRVRVAYKYVNLKVRMLDIC